MLRNKMKKQAALQGKPGSFFFRERPKSLNLELKNGIGKMPLKQEMYIHLS